MVNKSISEMSKMTESIKNPYVRSVHRRKDFADDFSDIDTRTFDPMDQEGQSHMDN